MKRLVGGIIITVVVLGSLFLVTRSRYFSFKQNTAEGTPVASNDAVFNELLNKVNDNYPYWGLFPYVSTTMIASYSGEPKKMFVTRKTDADSSVLLQELDNYLKQKFVSLQDLEQQGVTFTYSKNIDPQASIIQE